MDDDSIIIDTEHQRKNKFEDWGLKESANTEKWETNENEGIPPKLIGHSKSSPKGEIYRYKHLY